MYCSYCGKKIPDESIFCPECGKRLPLAAQPEENTKAEELKKNIQKEKTVRTKQPARTTKTEEVKNNIQKEKAARTTQPTKKKGGILKPLLILWLIACLFYVGKDFITDHFGGSESRPASTAAAVSKPSTSTNNTSATTPGATSQNTQTVKPSAANPITGNTGSGTAEEDQMPKTIDNLTTAIFDDFIYPEKMLESGIPQNAEWLQPYNAEGAWKYELIFEEDNYTEIGLCELIFGQNGVSLELYPSQSKYGNEVYSTDRETIGYDTYKGSMREEDFILQDPSESSTIVLSSFIRIEGTEYAFGSISTDSGAFGSFLFTRP